MEDEENPGEENQGQHGRQGRAINGIDHQATVRLWQEPGQTFVSTEREAAMSERKYAAIDTDDALQVVEAQAAEMPDTELQAVKAKFDAEAAKRQAAAKQPNLTREDVIKNYGFDPGWR
jgi:hypothetical protein